jgi:hypothetical protein
MTFASLALAAGLAFAGAPASANAGASAGLLFTPAPAGSTLELAGYGRRCFRDCFGPPWRRHCEVRCVEHRPRHWRGYGRWH